MPRIGLVFLLLVSLVGCYSVETSNSYNHNFTWAESSSQPIYLSIRDTKGTSFYFLLSRDSSQQDYKLKVRWHSPRKGDILFNSFNTTLKFLIDNERILSFQPVSRPRIVAYNLNSRGHEEEGVFSLTQEEFVQIAYANRVNVELNGRNNSVSAIFNKRNTFKAFQDFAKNSH